jgi:hypothetical protein
MAAGGGKPRWGVDIGWSAVDFEAGRGGRDLLVVAEIGGYTGPVEATEGEK